MQLRRRRGGPRQVPWVLVLPGLVLALAFHFVGPIAGGWYAFTNWDGLGDREWIGLDNFREIFATQTTRGRVVQHAAARGRFRRRSSTRSASALALALNRTVRTRHVLRSLFFVPVAVSPLAVAYIWQYIFDFTGALNRFLASSGWRSWQRPWLGDPDMGALDDPRRAGLAVLRADDGDLPRRPAGRCPRSSTRRPQSTALRRGGASGGSRCRCSRPPMTVNATLTLDLRARRLRPGARAHRRRARRRDARPWRTQVWKQTFVFGRFGYGAAFALILTVPDHGDGARAADVLRAREAKI